MIRESAAYKYMKLLTTQFELLVSNYPIFYSKSYARS